MLTLPLNTTVAFNIPQISQADWTKFVDGGNQFFHGLHQDEQASQQMLNNLNETIVSFNTESTQLWENFLNALSTAMAYMIPICVMAGLASFIVTALLSLFRKEPAPFTLFPYSLRNLLHSMLTMLLAGVFFLGVLVYFFFAIYYYGQQEMGFFASMTQGPLLPITFSLLPLAFYAAFAYVGMKFTISRTILGTISYLVLASVLIYASVKYLTPILLA